MNCWWVGTETCYVIIFNSWYWLLLMILWNVSNKVVLVYLSTSFLNDNKKEIFVFLIMSLGVYWLLLCRKVMQMPYHTLYFNSLTQNKSTSMNHNCCFSNRLFESIATLLLSYAFLLHFTCQKQSYLSCDNWIIIDIRHLLPSVFFANFQFC